MQSEYNRTWLGFFTVRNNIEFSQAKGSLLYIQYKDWGLLVPGGRLGLRVEIATKRYPLNIQLVWRNKDA